jgi:hypothetical protein
VAQWRGDAADEQDGQDEQDGRGEQGEQQHDAGDPGRGAGRGAPGLLGLPQLGAHVVHGRVDGLERLGHSVEPGHRRVVVAAAELDHPSGPVDQGPVAVQDGADRGPLGRVGEPDVVAQVLDELAGVLLQLVGGLLAPVGVLGRDRDVGVASDHVVLAVGIEMIGQQRG